MIYTIGYQALTPERLLAIAAHLRAGILDVRHKPVSRKPGFGGRQLAQACQAAGIAYRQAGDRLGGNGHTSDAGIAGLRQAEAAGEVWMLLCMEHAPGDCHRHHAICGPHFPEAIHLYNREMVRAADLQVALDTDAEDYPLVGELPPDL